MYEVDTWNDPSSHGLLLKIVTSAANYKITLMALFFSILCSTGVVLLRKFYKLFNPKINIYFFCLVVFMQPINEWNNGNCLVTWHKVAINYAQRCEGYSSKVMSIADMRLGNQILVVTIYAAVLTFDGSMTFTSNSAPNVLKTTTDYWRLIFQSSSCISRSVLVCNQNNYLCFSTIRYTHLCTDIW